MAKRFVILTANALRLRLLNTAGLVGIRFQLPLALGDSRTWIASLYGFQRKGPASEHWGTWVAHRPGRIEVMLPRSVSNLPLQSKTQRARVLRLLIDAKGSWVPLPEILALGYAQFGARIFELRRLGFQIENKTERDDSGVIHSWYRLLSDVSKAEPPTPEAEPVNPAPSWEERQRATGLPLFDLGISS